MKLTSFLSLACFLGILLSAGCGPSQHQVNRVIKVGTEIAEIQKEFYPAVTELGKVSVQLESLAGHQEATFKAKQGEFANALSTVEEAFTACQKAQDASVVGEPQGMTTDQYIAAQENFKILLRQALNKVKAATSKSHEVIEAISNTKVAKGVGKK
jgi:hypothetical protein